MPAGSTTRAIAEDLERAGLVRSAVAFRWRAELRRLDDRLAAGRYELRRSMSVGEILTALAAGASSTRVFVTIPEGWRAEEIARHLEANGVVSAAEFLDMVAGRRPVADLPLPEGAATYEGYLFPDTYDFGRAVPPEAVLRRLVRQFHSEVDEGVRTRGAARGLSAHELVTLASIIEREAVQPAERPLISAVYHNRLARGMPLQADPTTQYALVPFGAAPGGVGYWKGPLDPEDLMVDSAYNTYRVTGLPPGPICNPGMASIEAAAGPVQEPWLYFVAREDGSHVFARTMDEHLQNVVRAGRAESLPR